MGLVSCDSETFDSISNKLSVRNLQGSLLTISLVLATHVPRNLAKMFRRESLGEICHNRIRDSLVAAILMLSTWTTKIATTSSFTISQKTHGSTMLDNYGARVLGALLHSRGAVGGDPRTSRGKYM